MADGDKAIDKIGQDRDAQRGTVAALARDIAAVKQREEAASSGGGGGGSSSGGKGKGKKGGGSGSGGGGLSTLSEAKAAVRFSLILGNIRRTLSYGALQGKHR